MALERFPAEQHYPVNPMVLAEQKDSCQSPVDDITAGGAEWKNTNIPSTTGAQFHPPVHNCIPQNLDDEVHTRKSSCRNL